MQIKGPFGILQLSVVMATGFWAVLFTPVRAIYGQDLPGRSTLDGRIKMVADTAAPFSDSVHVLEDISVYTNLLPDVLSGINPVQMIHRDNPVWQDGLSAADLIRYFAGVHLKDYGGIGGLKTVNIRSLGTRHTAVMMDGLPLENAQNGQVDLGQYALTDLGSISVYKNQNSQIFQPATAFAASNAVYLESRKADLDSLHPQSGSLRLQTGSYGLFTGSAAGHRRLSPRWQLQGSVSALKTKGDYPFTYTNGVYDTTLRRDNGDVQRYSGKLSLNGTFKDSSTLCVTGYATGRQMGLPGAIVSNKYTNGERQDQTDFYLQTSYTRPVGKKDSLNLQFKYNHSYLKYTNPSITKIYVQGPDTSRGPLVNHYRQHHYFFSAADLYHLSKDWALAMSADLHHDRLQMDLNGLKRPYRWTAYGAVASRLKLRGMEIAGNLLYTGVWDHQQLQQSTIRQQKISPSISMSWQPFATNAFKLRAFYKKGFQMPTFNDLYLTQFRQTELRPERAEQMNLGMYYYKTFQGALASLQLELDGYYNQVCDKIVAIPTTSLFRWQMVNVGLAKVKGMEFTARTSWRLPAGWTLLSTLEYTYQDARDYTDKASVIYRHFLPYIAPHSGSFILTALKGPFSLNYSFIYEGERYSERFNSLVSYVPAWYTHDISLSYGLGFIFKMDATVLLSVDNLLDQQYDIIENYPMPGRNFKIGLQIDFK